MRCEVRLGIRGSIKIDTVQNLYVVTRWMLAGFTSVHEHQTRSSGCVSVR